jgi:hypothetical protein
MKVSEFRTLDNYVRQTLKKLTVSKEFVKESLERWDNTEVEFK